MAAPRSMGGLAALAVVLALGIVLARTQRIEGPSRAELAQALSLSGPAVATGELRSLDCAATPSGGYACRWQHYASERWQEQSGHIQLTHDGWRVERNPATGR